MRKRAKGRGQRAEEGFRLQATDFRGGIDGVT
jgi:hypothetical protein